MKRTVCLCVADVGEKPKGPKLQPGVFPSKGRALVATPSTETVVALTYDLERTTPSVCASWRRGVRGVRRRGRVRNRARRRTRNRRMPRVPESS